MLLHLSQMSEMDRSVTMTSFTVENANSFASGSLIFPSAICLLRVLISVAIEVGGIVNILYLTDELAIIKFAAFLAIIGSIDAKMSALIQADIGATIEARPMQYLRSDKLVNFWQPAATLCEKYKKGKLQVEPPSIAIVFFMGIIDRMLTFVYDAFYFYLMPFVPLITVVMLSVSTRHSPELAAPNATTI